LSYRAFIMAMEQLEQRLRAATSALDAADIRYAVIGGLAVAAWVARADPGATRTSRDIDLLIDRCDADRVKRILRELGLESQELHEGIAISPRRVAVHLIYAGEKVRCSHLYSAPTLAEAVRDPQGFSVLELQPLLRMKLTSLRDIDKVHTADLLRVGIVDNAIRNSLPADLRERLAGIEDVLDDEH
jgi:hypothetical protein